MLRNTVLALGLALTMSGVGVRAIETPNAAPADQNAPGQQAPALDNPPAATNPAPDAQKAPAASNQPDNNPVAPAPNPPDNNNPAAPAPNQPGVNSLAAPNPPDNNNPAAPAPVQPASPRDAPGVNNPPAPAPAQPNLAPEPTPAPGTPPQEAAAAPPFHSPLQEFVSHQVQEVGDLSGYIDQFRAAKRRDAVMVMYHMIRDHTLVSDAAKNVLARREEVSRPMDMPMEQVAPSPEEFIRGQIQRHEEELSNAQQMLAQANSPEEKSIFQQAVNATNRHLTWLRALDAGQPIRIGSFGPTTPLSRIAGYRAESSVRATSANGNGNGTRLARRDRRHTRAHRFRRRHRVIRAGYRPNRY
jgi:hypothetical protein